MFLVILKDGRSFLRFRVEKQRTTIGRSTDVDLYIPDARVSRLHCVLERRSDGHYLLDKSANGTYVNQVKVQEGLLQDGDVIVAGNFQIRFERGTLADPPETLMAAPEGGTISYDERMERFLYRRPVLRVRDSAAGPRTVPIRQDALRIGSAVGNDLVIMGLAEHQCQLLATHDGYTLRNLEPLQPATVDGRAVRAEQPIPYGSTIRFGRSELKLELEEGEEPIQPLQLALYQGMVGTTAPMQKIFSLIERFARYDLPVVVRGESGTGKELVAQALHQRGPRARGPFVAVNCGAIPAQLLESQLFGHLRGSFSGAVRDQVGFTEQAHRGVLFLDELGELPLEAQAKLLRFLETGHITPIGASAEKKVNVRVVTATHRDLAKMVSDGSFRADLFYRLMVLSIELPPLRERPADIAPLVQYFLEQMSGEDGPIRLTPDALLALERYDWPGNIRELRHTLLRATTTAESSTLSAKELSFLAARSAPAPASSSAPMSAAAPGPERASGSAQPVSRMEVIERDALVQALEAAGGNRSEAARLLGIARSTLHARIRKFAIEA